jgi:hypothetical protein
MVVWRASPLRNEAPRAGAGASGGTSVGAATGAGAEGVEGAGSWVSGASGTEAARVGSTGSGGVGALTGAVVLVLVDAAGVGLGCRWNRSIDTRSE